MYQLTGDAHIGATYINLVSSYSGTIFCHKRPTHTQYKTLHMDDVNVDGVIILNARVTDKHLVHKKCKG